jgi:recombination protein RecA
MKRRVRGDSEDNSKYKGFLSTGSTMLNLAMTGHIKKGWPVGRISTMPGQSAAGKTIVVLSTLTEACLDEKFDDYLLIYDDVERRCDFNFAKLFKPLIPRLITPSGMLYKDIETTDDDTGISDTIQHLRNRMLNLRKEGKKFVYIADSLDSFTTDEELEKEMRRAIASAKSDEAAAKIAGSFNAEKAKILGQILRMINKTVADTDSIFILTQQLRQKMNVMPGQSPFTTSGGEAPYYYSHIRPYLSKVASLKKNERKVGVTSRVRMDKNSVTGKLRDIEFNIYYDLGIDDIGSMVDFLLKEKHWKPGAWIDAPELDLRENGRDKLTKKIEELNLEGRLKRVVQKVWNQIEDSLLLNRKSRYGE